MPQPTLNTTVGEFPLHEYRLGLAGREWSILHSNAVISYADEAEYLISEGRLPYGVALWPAAIALAHDLAAREHDLAGTAVLELGAGTGLPGIVAASLGAHVVQTDRQQAAMAVCRRNGERNQTSNIEYRIVDWSEWNDDRRYDWIIGSDILYAGSMHDRLRAIFESNLTPGGRVLLSDPFRAMSLPFLESMESAGWSVTLSKWNVGGDDAPRPVGVYELRPPAR